MADSATQNVAEIDASPQAHHRFAAAVLDSRIVIWVSVTLATVVMAMAYRQGWTGGSSGTVAYFAAQAIAIIPTTVVVLRRKTPTINGALGLVFPLVMVQYLFKWMYSPDQLRFPDELQHMAGTTNVLLAHHLFVANSGLPIAQYYPGLESLAAQLSSLSGLSVTSAAFILMAAVHLAICGLLFAIVRRIVGSPRAGAIAVVIFMTAPHYLFFSMMFVYQNLALVFAGMVVLAAWHWRGGESWRYGAVAGGAIVAVVETHHATAALLFIALGLFSSMVWWREREWRPLAVTGALGAAVALWFSVVAPETLSYFSQSGGLSSYWKAIVNIFHGVLPFASQGSKGAIEGTFADRMAASVGEAALVTLLICSWILLRRGWKRFEQGWILGAIAGSFAIFAMLAYRVTSINGSQVYGRLSIFVWLMIGIVIAAGALISLKEPTPFPGPVAKKQSRLIRGGRAIVPIAALVSLAYLGGIESGWPAPWGRLPGPFLVSGFERASSDESNEAALWMLTYEGSGHRFASDLDAQIVFRTYGHQISATGRAATIFYNPVISGQDGATLQAQQVQFLIVDFRDSQQLPLSGSYFASDPLANEHKHPISVNALAKFASVPNISLLYASRNLQIFNIHGSYYYLPSALTP